MQIKKHNEFVGVGWREEREIEAVQLLGG